MRWTTLLIAGGLVCSAASVSQAASADSRWDEPAARQSGDEALIDRLARFYRIQNYEMNRLDREQYNRQSDALQQRMAAWEDSGRNPEQTRALITWLNVSVGGGYLPTVRPNAPAIETLPPPGMPATSGSIASEFTPSLSGERVGSQLNPEIRPTPAVTLPAVPLPEDPTLSPALPQGATATPEAPKLSAHEDQTSENSILSGIRSTIEDLVKRAEQVPPISSLPSSVPPPVTLNQLADVPDAPPFVSPAFTPKTVPNVDINVPKVGGLAEMRSGSRRPSGKASGGSSEGTVNFTEVAALARGYNVSVEQLETKLSAPGDWTVDTLEPLVDELEQLGRRREDLNLYESALPAEERSQLTSRQGLDQVVRLMGKRIAETRQQLGTAAEAGGSGATRRDLTQLDSFSRRLAAIAGGK